MDLDFDIFNKLCRETNCPLTLYTHGITCKDDPEHIFYIYKLALILSKSSEKTDCHLDKRFDSSFCLCTDTHPEPDPGMQTVTYTCIYSTTMTVCAGLPDVGLRV